MPTFAPQTLSRAIADAFNACGVPDEEARIVAEHLIEAELCGVRSHGVIRLPQYVQAVEEGRITPGATLTVVSQSASTAVIDGHHGFGQVMARRAMEIAIEKAEQSGVAAVTLVNCGHTGRLGSYTAQAARRRMVGIMMVNAGGHGQWMAPYGGTAGRLATNPISIAVPNGSEEPIVPDEITTEARSTRRRTRVPIGAEDPIVLDIATSAAPEGKIRAMMSAGDPIPPGWIIDHHGQPTTDPADLYGPPRGALLPFGGHKGFGLALIIEALAGGLSGAGCCREPDAPMEGRTDGVFMIALNVESFCTMSEFSDRIEQLTRHVKSSPPAPGFDEVLVPGELEARQRRRQRDTGLAIDEGTWQTIRPTLDRLGIEVDPLSVD